MPFISGIGPLELGIVLVIGLIVVGPGRLPEVGSALGRSIREFRAAATEVKDASRVDAAIAPDAGSPAVITGTPDGVSLPDEQGTPLADGR